MHGVETLKELTQDNLSQQERLAHLHLLLHEKIETLKQAISLNGDKTEAMSVVGNESSKQLMNKISDSLDDFIAEERKLLEQRTLAYDETKRGIYFNFTLLIVVLFVMSLLACLFFFRYLINLINKLTTSAKEISKGNYRQLTEMGNSEIGTLVKAFNKMSEDIKFRTAQLETANHSLKELSQADGLTHLANRRYFDQKLSDEFQRLKRSPASLSLLMIDIDYFKAYNDYYGHLAGDECLRKVAEILTQNALRPTDFVARYGGELKYPLKNSREKRPEDRQYPESVRSYNQLRMKVNELC